MLKKYIGDKAFYQKVLAIAIPIIIQTAITNIVSLLDNVMVGKVGTLPMSGVSIANQLITVFTLAIFGATTAAGLFAAQYAGKEDHQGVKNCFNIKIYIALIISTLIGIIFVLFGRPLISSFLDEQLNTVEDNLATLNYGMEYLYIMLISFIPFGLKEAMSSTLREVGETVTPMFGSSIAIIVNVVFNYILIFGKFGFPQLGIAGAAIATVLSRFVELFLVWYLAFRNREKHVFLQKPFSNLTITTNLIKDIIVRGAPLMFNEILWSVSIAGINQCYSTRGLVAVAAITILNTASNLYIVVCNSMGVSLSIIIGQVLGTGDIERAKDENTKLIVFSTFLSAVLGLIFFFVSPWFPELYNTTAEIKHIAVILLEITALKLPIQAIYMCCYFTMRSGGKTVITFLFDSFFSTVICWPLAFILANFTGMSLITMFIYVNALDFLKVILGLYLVKKGVWINTLVA